MALNDIEPKETEESAVEAAQLVLRVKMRTSTHFWPFQSFLLELARVVKVLVSLEVLAWDWLKARSY